MAKIVFLGGGGFAKEVLEIAVSNGHEVVAYAGDGASEFDRPYWGLKEALLDRRDSFDCVAVAFGVADRQSLLRRREVLQWVVSNGLPAESLVSPHAICSKSARLGPGCIIAHGVIINVDARLGAFVIANSGAIIGHDVQLGDNVTMAPTAFIGGASSVGNDSLVGPGATILQGLSVGANVVIGVGASVLRDVPSGATVYPLRSKVLRA